MNTRSKFAFFMLLLTLILAACTGTFAPQTRLDGGAWILTHIHGNPVLPGTLPTLTFDAGQVSGNGSCNGFGGEYTQSGAQLTFGALMSTMMACDPAEVMGQEQAYLAALGSAAEFDLTDGNLILFNSDGIVVLSFTTQDTSLEGKTWQMTFYNNGMGGVVSALDGSTVTAQFGDGVLSGSSGCNLYSAAYTQEKLKLSIGPAAGTEMYCEGPAGVMEQESQYLNALGSTASYRMEANRLTLFDTDGSIVAEYTLIP